MATTFANTAALTHHNRLDVPLRQAKAVLNSVEEQRSPVGRALRRAIAIVGLSDKEAADLLDVDKAQLSRWLSGHESIQMHRLYATKLHGPFAIEMARDAQGCTVETTVTYRVTA